MNEHCSVADDPIDDWIGAHFDEEVAFLRELVRVPTDTPPGDNRPHAERTAELLEAMGFAVERHAPPQADVDAAGLVSVVNLVVRHRFAQAPDAGGPTIALNAHGDVVPPGHGWSVSPYDGVVVDGRMYGRGVAVSKSDFATYVFALRALMETDGQRSGAIELHFTYDEEFGGALGPAWLLANAITKPDLALGPGFAYAVVTAHNGCLQLAVTIGGRSAHAAMPETGVDALKAAVRVIDALYAHAETYATMHSQVAGIGSPSLNIGRIEGGTNTNVVPDRVTFKLDRRMIPEEDPVEVERALRGVIEAALPTVDGLTLDIRRLLLARALAPLPGHERLVDALVAAAAHTDAPLAVAATPLYTDARLYGEAGVPIVLFGAGPRSILEANAKRADENLALDDLRRATTIVARALGSLLVAPV